MSISIEFADGEGGRTEGTQVATNRGWSEFGAWVDTLPMGEGYDGVIQLWEHGHVFDVAGLAKGLAKALKDHAPKKNVRSVAENVLGLAKANVSVRGMFVSDDS